MNTRELDSNTQTQTSKSGWATFNGRHELRGNQEENKNQNEVNKYLIKHGCPNTLGNF